MDIVEIVAAPAAVLVAVVAVVTECWSDLWPVVMVVECCDGDSGLTSGRLDGFMSDCGPKADSVCWWTKGDPLARCQ